MPTVVVFLSRGGLGDCGQQVVPHVLNMPADFKVRAIAREAATHNQVEDKPLLAQNQIIDQPRLELVTFDYASQAESPEGAAAAGGESAGAVSQLAEALAGVDAVIACPSNRQPKMERRAAASMRNIVAGMRAAGVHRIVYVSTVGVDSKPMPWTWVGTLFGAMLATIIKSVKLDFREADAVVRDSGLDYLIVRTMGLDPNAKPIGKWKVLPADDRKGPLAHNIAKADVGKFLLQEALQPTLHRQDVQIGWTLDQAKESQAHR
jgi:uncharacterized protein YbjT (DUF2867 family)